MSDNGEQPFLFTDIRQAVRDQNSKSKNQEPNIVYMSWADQNPKKLGLNLTSALKFLFSFLFSIEM